jgi:hypothetical protein
MKRLSIIITIISFVFTTQAMAITTDDLIKKYGKRTIMDFIQDKTGDQSITVQVGNTLYKKTGNQSIDYITAASISYDFKRLSISPEQTHMVLQEYVEKQTAAVIEHQHKTAAQAARKKQRDIDKKRNFKLVTGHGLKSVVVKSFSKSLIEYVLLNNGRGVVVFKIDNDYFGTGDKINKTFAIESTRWFAKVPKLKFLKIVIRLSNDTRQYKKGAYALSITREKIESHYKMKFSPDLFEKFGAPWRQQFIRKYDSKIQRKQFAQNFAVFKDRFDSPI